jgi:DNA adenine methylase
MQKYTLIFIHKLETKKLKQLKTPVTYYGGKQTLLKHILPLFPVHNCYTEAFAGGAAAFFAKEPAEVEVINDTNGNLVNFYCVLKNDFKALKLRVDTTLHSREQHEFAGWVYDNPKFFDTIERAWAVWALSKMGFASKLDGTWGYDKAKNSMPKKITNSKEGFTIDLSKQLEQTQIECTDGLRIIASRDGEDTFHFIDPPYVGTNCGHYGGYTLADFDELLELCSGLKGKFMLTMFPNELLSEYAVKFAWRIIEVSRHITVSLTNRRKQTELIVMNY